MKKLRILIDDAGQCRSQRAVLAAFAATLPASAERVWSSALPAPTGWVDAPAESARRLAVRIEALAPAADTLTVFLPGHIVPGELAGLATDVPGVPLPEWTTVSDLDLFAVDAGSPLAAHLARHVAVNPDYQSCSSFLVAGFTSLPSGLAASGLASALLLTQRPWYFAQVPGREAWLRWLAKAFQHKLIALHDVEADVREGAVRPSMLQDARAVAVGGELPACPDTTLDALFTAPEVRLTDPQYAMLHSEALQERTSQFAKAEALRKRAEAAPVPPQPRWLRAARQVRGLPRRALKAAYRVYSVTLRPMIRGSASARSRSQ